MDILKPEITYFLELVKAKSFTQASYVLGIRQASLSKAIQKIEKQLGLPLFIRSNRGVTLTKEGQEFLKKIGKIEDLWNQEMNQFGHNNLTQFAGSVDIGMHSVIARNYYPTLHTKIKEELPLLEIDLKLMTSLEVSEYVSRGEIDLGLVAGVVKHPNLVATKYCQEFVGLYGNKSASTLYYHPQMINVAAMLRQFKIASYPIPDYELIAQLTCEQKALALLPNSLSFRYPQLNLVKKQNESVPISFIYSKERYHSPVFKNLLQFIRNSI